jgi:hypothetical protein
MGNFLYKNNAQTVGRMKYFANTHTHTHIAREI